MELKLVVRLKWLCVLSGLNRTFMELKPTNETHKKPKQLSLNRTFMELKPLLPTLGETKPISLNRTFMELKRKRTVVPQLVV